MYTSLCMWCGLMWCVWYSATPRVAPQNKRWFFITGQVPGVGKEDHWGCSAPPKYPQKLRKWLLTWSFFISIMYNCVNRFLSFFLNANMHVFSHASLISNLWEFEMEKSFQNPAWQKFWDFKPKVPKDQTTSGTQGFALNVRWRSPRRFTCFLVFFIPKNGEHTSVLLHDSPWTWLASSTLQPVDTRDLVEGNTWGPLPNGPCCTRRCADRKLGGNSSKSLPFCSKLSEKLPAASCYWVYFCNIPWGSHDTYMFY